MAVKIRLKRVGKIRTPHYRIVVADSRKKRDGRVIEEIGTYNPKTEPSTIQLQSERAQYWLGVGAQPTEAVAAILKLTGDIGGQASLKDPEAKADKAALFDAALKELHATPPKAAKKTTKKAEAKAEADDEPKPEKKAKAKKSEAPAEAQSDEPTSEGAQADEPQSDEPQSEEAQADEAPAEEAQADAGPAEETPAEEAKSDEAPAEDEAPADEKPADEKPAEEAASEDTKG